MTTHAVAIPITPQPGLWDIRHAYLTECRLHFCFLLKFLGNGDHNCLKALSIKLFKCAESEHIKALSNEEIKQEFLKQH